MNKLLRAIVFLLFWSANIFSGKCGDCFANLVLGLAVKLKLVEIVPERDKYRPSAEFGESIAGGVQNTGSIQDQPEDYKRLED